MLGVSDIRWCMVGGKKQEGRGAVEGGQRGQVFMIRRSFVDKPEISNLIRDNTTSATFFFPFSPPSPSPSASDLVVCFLFSPTNEKSTGEKARRALRPHRHHQLLLTQSKKRDCYISKRACHHLPPLPYCTYSVRLWCPGGHAGQDDALCHGWHAFELCVSKRPKLLTTGNTRPTSAPNVNRGEFEQADRVVPAVHFRLDQPSTGGT